MFKIREKNVAKNKKGSIIRGTIDKNEYIIKNIDMENEIKEIRKDIVEKEPYITAALPTLIEILLRYKNEYKVGSFLSIDEFYQFSKSEK